jgi:integrase/recombinase XerD
MEKTFSKSRCANSGPVASYLERMSESSVNTMRRSLENVAELFQAPDPESVRWPDVTAKDVLQVRERLAGSQQPASINRILSAVPGVMRECLRTGLIGPERYLEISELSGIPLQQKTATQPIEADDVEAAIKGCTAENTTRGYRDGAILGLIAYQGLKRSEIAALDVRDIILQGGPISIQVGNRRDALDPRALHLISSWLRERGSEPGSLFGRVRGKRRVDSEPLTTQAVYDVVRKRLEKRLAGVSPEDLRFAISNPWRD